MSLLEYITHTNKEKITQAYKEALLEKFQEIANDTKLPGRVQGYLEEQLETNDGKASNIGNEIEKGSELSKVFKHRFLKDSFASSCKSSDDPNVVYIDLNKLIGEKEFQSLSREVGASKAYLDSIYIYDHPVDKDVFAMGIQVKPK